VTIRVSVWGPSPRPRIRAAAGRPPRPRESEIIFDGRPLAAQVLRGELAPGTALRGPALCALPESTLLVPPGWSGAVDAHGTCRLERAEGRR
jgi:N-methylhydantoinase A